MSQGNSGGKGNDPRPPALAHDEGVALAEERLSGEAIYDGVLQKFIATRLSVQTGIRPFASTPCTLGRPQSCPCSTTVVFLWSVSGAIH